MAISLLEELDQLEADNQLNEFKVAFFLTYTLNLQFFESIILPKLERLRIPYIGILADCQKYQESLQTPFQPGFCGKSYILSYSRWLRVLQHGKLLWLHGNRDILYVGSHNTTRSGLNDQLETTVCLDSSDLGQLNALKKAHNTVSALIKGASELSQIWKLIPEPLVGNYQPTIQFLWSGNGGLLTQMLPIIKNPYKIRVVTPYLDASALRELSTSMAAKEVVLDLPFEGADTPLVDATTTIANLTSRTVAKPNRLHGKAYEFSGPNVNYIAIGSANCTHAGLIKSIEDGGNSEFLVLFQGGSLEDQDVEFVKVKDPADFPGTGRSWDGSSQPPESGITYLSATYKEHVLSIEWECEGPLLKPKLTVGKQVFEISKSPTRLTLQTLDPDSIKLTGELNGVDVSARAWIVSLDAISAHASNISIIHRRSYLESDDPIQQTLGIEYEIFQLVRILNITNKETSPIITKLLRHLTDAEVEAAVSVFEYSPNPEEIMQRAASLIIGNHATDPLAIVRGLIARITGPAPVADTIDAESIEQYNTRKNKAMHRVSDLLISHLRNLVKISHLDWESTPKERVNSCLQGTFEVTVLIWWKVLRIDREYFERFVQAMLDILEVISNNLFLSGICKDLSITGPLILAIGTTAESTSQEEERDILREYLKRLELTRYRAVVQEWANKNPMRATMIMRVQSESNMDLALKSRLRTIDRLVGIPDQEFIKKQDQKWGILVKFIAANGCGSPTKTQLMVEGALKYKGHPVWIRCIEEIQTGHVPTILRVSRPICQKCNQTISQARRHELEHGEAVLCPNCSAILMFGKLE